MNVLLVSTYELGHQPLHVAAPAAALRAAGHSVRTVDLSVEPADRADLEWSDGVAFSVPMHTAMRLAVEAARRVRAIFPDLPLCLYGLYAGFGPAADGEPVDYIVAGAYDQGLLDWAAGLAAGLRPHGSTEQTTNTANRLPVRAGLPGLDRYAHLQIDHGHRQVGYVEASHGCRHRCRHCPIPVIYDGKVRIVDQDVVLADVEQLVSMGARHITFGDPDFLNAPAHSLRVVRTIHQAFPGLTFDVTTKVELIVRQAGRWEDLAGYGLLFVVSAFETTNDAILALLDKGHTRRDEEAAVEILHERGIQVRPTWLPFTPWTTIEDVRAIVRFIVDHDLVGSVDPVQLTIRLLIPTGSLLLDRPELAPFLDRYDPDLLGWQWHAEDPEVDALAVRLADIHAEGVAGGLEPEQLFAVLAAEIAGGRAPTLPAGARPPRLTEPWFC